MTAPVPVVIVGGGPVGLGLAIELAQRGVRCTVVERHREPQPIPKGQNLTPRTLEHFEAWGAEAALRAARTVPAGHPSGGLTAYGSLLGPWHYDWLQRAQVAPYYTQRNERLPQYATERVLRTRAAALDGIELLEGWSADALQVAADGVALDIAPTAGGTGRRLQARYLVGCDGSHSRVRQQAGIAQRVVEHGRLMVLLVFRSTELHALLERYPGKAFFNVLDPALDGYWKFLGRVDLGSEWFFHAPVPEGTTRDNFDFAALVRGAVGADFALDIRHIGFWDLRFALAHDYRAGAVFIAGDAAHSHPPYGGHGINAGFEDARNLGWKLAATLQGWGGPALLDSYGAERQPVFDATIRDFIAHAIEDDRRFLRAHDPVRDRADFEQAWSVRASGAQDEVQRFAPHYEGSPLVGMPPDAAPARPGAAGGHSHVARAGHHLSPARLSGGGTLHAALGTGFALLAFDAPAARVAAFIEAARALGLPLALVQDSAADERARYQARLVLVRPDGYVAWVEGDTADPRSADALLRQAAGFPSR